MNSPEANPGLANRSTNSASPDSPQRGGEASGADAARRKMIAEAAYRLSERRGFEPGHELEDWLAAENEVVKSWLQEDASKIGSG